MKQDPQAVASLSSLVVGGWEAIQAAQQGHAMHRPIDTSKPAKRPATDADRALLAQHGEAGLRERGMFGVLDRLNLPLFVE